MENFSPLRIRIGVLALQGAVEAHRAHIEALGAEFLSVKRASDLEGIDGLILPGGESTTLLKLLRIFEMQKALLKKAESIPFWGICAGAILMAKKVQHPEQECFGLLNLSVTRNAYGRQLESFSTELEVAPYESVAFIRAPKFLAPPDARVKVLARLAGQDVWIEDGLHMATSFHPELSESRPSSFHRYFFEKVLAAKNLQDSKIQVESQSA